MFYFLLFVFLQGTVQFDIDGCCQICKIFFIQNAKYFKNIFKWVRPPVLFM